MVLNLILALNLILSHIILLVVLLESLLQASFHFSGPSDTMISFVSHSHPFCLPTLLYLFEPPVCQILTQKTFSMPSPNFNDFNFHRGHSILTTSSSHYIQLLHASHNGNEDTCLKKVTFYKLVYFFHSCNT